MSDQEASAWGQNVVTVVRIPPVQLQGGGLAYQLRRTDSFPPQLHAESPDEGCLSDFLWQKQARRMYGV